MPRKLSEEALNERAIRNRYKSVAALDIHGNRLVLTCSHCGASNVPCHKHRTSLCVDCGKLYERWLKAARKGIKSELRLLKPILLARYEKALATDKSVATRSAKFFEQVEQMEVNEMDIISKMCKQCGRDLPIDKYRRYTARGAGMRYTMPGYNTICKDCESINNRAAAAMKRGDEAMIGKLREHYKVLQDRGFPPVTAAARRLLGVEAEVRDDRKSLDDLLAQVSGIGVTDAERHCRLLRERSYVSVDEAYEVHKTLVAELTKEGLYEVATELLEQWFDDEEDA